MELQNIINKLKSKKELKGLDHSFIKKRVLDYLNRNKVDLSNERSKSYRLMFKSLRRKIREVYGVFREVKETRSLDFYKKIFDEFNPKTVMDLGCGLEPLNYINLYKKAKYYFYDINSQEIGKLNELFKNNVKGKASVFSLLDNNLEKLPKVDLCLILKVLESLESIKKNFSKELLSKIKAKVIVASFAKIALGKKVSIRKSGRSWFRKILKQLNYNYKIIDYDDEIVFIIRKDNVILI